MVRLSLGKGENDEAPETTHRLETDRLTCARCSRLGGYLTPAAYSGSRLPFRTSLAAQATPGRETNADLDPRSLVDLAGRDEWHVYVGVNCRWKVFKSLHGDS